MGDYYYIDWTQMKVSEFNTVTGAWEEMFSIRQVFFFFFFFFGGGGGGGGAFTPDMYQKKLNIWILDMLLFIVIQIVPKKFFLNVWHEFFLEPF